jgi:hypothetical protein
MATTTINQAADVPITIALASLASSSGFTAGRESTALNLSSDDFVDGSLSGKITVGTTPTVNTQILVYVFAPIEDTPEWPDVMDGTDSDETLTSAGVGRGFLRLVVALDVDSTTSNRTYPFGPVAIAPLFGGVMPQRLGVFVTHNTGVALNATGGNHVISFAGIKYDIA